MFVLLRKLLKQRMFSVFLYFELEVVLTFLMSLKTFLLFPFLAFPFFRTGTGASSGDRDFKGQTA